MITYGIKTPTSSEVLLVSDDLSEAETSARAYAGNGTMVDLVRVELIGSFRPGVAYEPASRTCYVCGRDRGRSSADCPKASHP